ncbi:cobaltochelatase subunit CobN [Leptolyngbyaceae cyanobacterium CCMR0082]|uniref:Cobaltochelatase subunit CobN n=1 Tax=Adonisia turfae CCMR0082 TaxID=2304604 RepID=A0A6M0S9R7_9CYAN|nr:cobaltochelatase subunit CobN [Adonisia turfae]NEZ64741.1 cobaltochelatase subunit CobN [Adonisia turfae CCMR0082]
MHRIAATPGGWSPGTDGVIILEQTPAPIVILTAADTEIQTLAASLPRLPKDFPEFRVASLLQLQQELSIDTYVDDVLSKAQVIVVRLLGGRSYWSYGLERLREVAEFQGISLVVLPGDDRPDPALSSLGTVPLIVADTLWHYFVEGGAENLTYGLQYLARTCLEYPYEPPAPKSVPQWGEYAWKSRRMGEWEREETDKNVVISPRIGVLGGTSTDIVSSRKYLKPQPTVAIFFYRAHYLSGNTRVIDTLCEALQCRGLNPLPLFLPSLRNPDIQAQLLTELTENRSIDLILNTTGFSLAKLNAESPQVDFWQKLDVPVLQVMLSGGSEDQWQQQWRGLSPRDIAMNVALPEVDGRIISRAVSFKAVQTDHPQLETTVMAYEPKADRIEFVADLAANWVTLRRTAPQQRKVALILANYPNKDGRLANGVGLDTPASCLEILRSLTSAGYTVTPGTIPPEEILSATGADLIDWLTQGITNDPEGQGMRPVHQTLSAKDYQEYFQMLPAAVQQGVIDRWGAVAPDVDIPIAGIQLGNIFIGIQPSRGYDDDPSLNYHAPDLEPTHRYLAFYAWLRCQWGAQAVVHVGKHGNLEWLPGKSLALSETCYPEVALGPMPHLYPFIVNDPGEGTQAKRRAQAVILDHLTPPLTRAELYGSLHRLEALIDEYYDAESLDPKRLPVIRDHICSLVTQANLQQDLSFLPGLAPILPQLQLSQEKQPGSRRNDQSLDSNAFSEFITQTDGYLCDLKEAQIRDGLHILGLCPDGRQLRDLMVAIARQPGPGRQGLTRAIADDWGWDLHFDPLTADLGTVIKDLEIPDTLLQPERLATLYTVGDAVEVLEHQAACLVEQLLAKEENFVCGPKTTAELTWIRQWLWPKLTQTSEEITHLLHSLNGGYVPSGSSGAPTRGRADVLPTGRNFYSVDIRGLPTESAWDVGRRAAENLVERYTQEQGDYPKTLGLSMWGTATMRTGGDDMAEALALLGVRPVWDGVGRRVVDFEILPLSVLQRPRVDVTLRISGFFRDAFPNLIDLFNSAVAAVAALDEPSGMNPLATQVKQEADHWQSLGFSAEDADIRAQYRVFGSKPGAYGAGLQGLIEAQNWSSDRDLAQAYINWSCYAYGRPSTGESSEQQQPGNGKLRSTSVPDVFQQRLGQLQIVLHNQDNREHDLLDSDDYYQFQGGLVAAVRATQGKNPTAYFGDHSRPQQPRIRSLPEEISRVYRSRVVNPKWIAGVMRHGYKGAFEMAATVDYLFAYDATTHAVADFMYAGVAETYILDDNVQRFIQTHNPWALRDMSERLLEAHQRGLWQQVSPEMLEQLRAIVLDAEAHIEETL